MTDSYEKNRPFPINYTNSIKYKISLQIYISAKQALYFFSCVLKCQLVNN